MPSESYESKIFINFGNECKKLKGHGKIEEFLKDLEDALTAELAIKSAYKSDNQLRNKDISDTSDRYIYIRNLLKNDDYLKLIDLKSLDDNKTVSAEDKESITTNVNNLKAALDELFSIYYQMVKKNAASTKRLKRHDENYKSKFVEFFNKCDAAIKGYDKNEPSSENTVLGEIIDACSEYLNATKKKEDVTVGLWFWKSTETRFNGRARTVKEIKEYCEQWREKLQ